jgi:hypothetical protein
MTKGDELKSLTVEQLVAAFEAAGIEQSHAELSNKISKYNRLFRKMVAIQEELKARDGDQRSALVPLLKHANPQVRYMAAEYTLVVAPVASRQALQDLSDKNIYPQAANARGTLRSLAIGRRQPT